MLHHHSIRERLSSRRRIFDSFAALLILVTSNAYADHEYGSQSDESQGSFEEVHLDADVGAIGFDWTAGANVTAKFCKLRVYHYRNGSLLKHGIGEIITLDGTPNDVNTSETVATGGSEIAQAHRGSLGTTVFQENDSVHVVVDLTTNLGGNTIQEGDVVAVVGHFYSDGGGTILSTNKLDITVGGPEASNLVFVECVSDTVARITYSLGYDVDSLLGQSIEHGTAEIVSTMGLPTTAGSHTVEINIADTANPIDITLIATVGGASHNSESLTINGCDGTGSGGGTGGGDGGTGGGDGGGGDGGGGDGGGGDGGGGDTGDEFPTVPGAPSLPPIPDAPWSLPSPPALDFTPIASCVVDSTTRIQSHWNVEVPRLWDETGQSIPAASLDLSQYNIGLITIPLLPEHLAQGDIKTTIEQVIVVGRSMLLMFFAFVYVFKFASLFKDFA